MDLIYRSTYQVRDCDVDCFGRLKLSTVLYLAQEAAGRHSDLLGTDYDTLAQRRLFWAVTRHRVQITRLPVRGETITVETWPMPTTRVAYPRSIVAYDEAGNEVFRSITLWVLMDLNNRSMVLPGKSGIEVAGTLRGNELASPMGLPVKALQNHRSRYVNYTDLDRNGHMNNTKYLDWICDLLGSSFHTKHTIREFTVCYLCEAREAQRLELAWDFPEEGCLMVDAHREQEGRNDRIFAAKILFD